MQEKLNRRKFFLRKTVLMLIEKNFEAHFRDQFKKVFIISIIGQIKQYLQKKVEDFS